jgi:hypothetical protein
MNSFKSQLPIIANQYCNGYAILQMYKSSMRVTTYFLSRPITFITIGFLLSILPVESAFAWGASGHRMISKLAIQSLPAELPAFIRTEKTAELIGELGREPDRSKGTGNSHDHDLDPGHFINLSDNFTVANVVSVDPLPETREDYDSALRLNGTNEYKAGFLPYSIVDGWEQLQRDFAYWRADLAKEKSATSKTEQAWFTMDRELREMIILRDLGYWSHFVADGSQPMHVSIHYDGWGDYPNPEGYTSTKGFHAKFEGSFIANYIHPEDVIKKLRPPHDCSCSIQTRTMAYLRETHSQLLPLLALDKKGAFSGNTPAGNDFAASRLASAVSELRDMIISAWRLSAESTVGYPPIPLPDIESGKTNPFRQMQGLD